MIKLSLHALQSYDDGVYTVNLDQYTRIQILKTFSTVGNCCIVNRLQVMHH